MPYAHFPDKQRPAIDRSGMTELYDSGDHKIGAIAQQEGSSSQSLAINSQKGGVKLEELNQRF